MTIRCAVYILLALFYFTGSARAGAPVVADVSSRVIDINSKFTGTELWLFGARQAAGELIYVVRGPKQSYRVSEKKRVMGIWVNSNPVRFHDVPGYYLFGSTEKEISPEKSLKYAKLFQTELPGAFGGSMSALFPSHTPEYHRPLMRAQINDGLYSPELLQARFIGDTLFKASLPFSENIPRGVYTVEIYLMNDGEPVSMQTIPINVRKKGFDAFLYELAYNYSWVYAFICIAIALGLGWVGGQIFKRG